MTRLLTTRDVMRLNLGAQPQSYVKRLKGPAPTNFTLDGGPDN